MEKTDKPDTVSQKFCDVLRELKGGAIEHEASTMLQTLAGSVRELQKGGSLTLVLKIAPMGGKHPGRVLVDHTITMKEPKPESDVAVMYATADGKLQRKDPDQLQLDGMEGG